MTDVRKGDDGKAGLLKFTRRTTGLYLITVAVVLVVLVFQLWPVATDTDPKTWAKESVVLSFDVSIGPEARLLLLVILIGALGSFIHAATSFSTYVGNDSLKPSWLWWYFLRPFMGMALALIFYFVLRGGMLSGGAGAENISLFGIAAVAGLVGMFSKQATDKLEDVFDNLFKTTEGKGDAERKDSLSEMVPVTEVMIHRKMMSVYMLPDGEEREQAKIKDLIEILHKGVSRVPILNQEGHARFLAHDSILYKFVTRKARDEGAGFNIEDVLLEDFLNDEEVRTLVSAIVFVSPKANLGEVKIQMDATPKCRDAFVTESGLPNRPVLGWLTNLDLARRLRA